MFHFIVHCQHMLLLVRVMFIRLHILKYKFNCIENVYRHRILKI